MSLTRDSFRKMQFMPRFTYRISPKVGAKHQECSMPRFLDVRCKSCKLTCPVPCNKNDLRCNILVRNVKGKEVEVVDEAFKLSRSYAYFEELMW